MESLCYVFKRERVLRSLIPPNQKADVELWPSGPTVGYVFLTGQIPVKLMFSLFRRFVTCASTVVIPANFLITQLAVLTGIPKRGWWYVDG